jgi:hypothetical protein
VRLSNICIFDIFKEKIQRPSPLQFGGKIEVAFMYCHEVFTCKLLAIFFLEKILFKKPTIQSRDKCQHEWAIFKFSMYR